MKNEVQIRSLPELLKEEQVLQGRIERRQNAERKIAEEIEILTPQVEGSESTPSLKNTIRLGRLRSIHHRMHDTHQALGTVRTELTTHDEEARARANTFEREMTRQKRQLTKVTMYLADEARIAAESQLEEQEAHPTDPYVIYGRTLLAMEKETPIQKTIVPTPEPITTAPAVEPLTRAVVTKDKPRTDTPIIAPLEPRTEPARTNGKVHSPPPLTEGARIISDSRPHLDIINDWILDQRNTLSRGKALDPLNVPGWEFLRDFERRILHEDDDFLVIDKPAGLNTYYTNNVLVGLEEALRSVRGDGIYVTDRLDREISGIVVIPKSEKAKTDPNLGHKELQRNKRYYALVEGKLAWPEEDPMESFVTEHELIRATFNSMRVVKPGEKVNSRDIRTAITRIEPKMFFKTPKGDYRTLIGTSIIAGRPAQIRVITAHMGNPVLGDSIYNGNKVNAPRAMLHAHEVTLVHPRTGETMTFEAPIPEVFQQEMDKMDAEPIFHESPTRRPEKSKGEHKAKEAKPAIALPQPEETIVPSIDGNVAIEISDEAALTQAPIIDRESRTFDNGTIKKTFRESGNWRFMLALDERKGELLHIEDIAAMAKGAGLKGDARLAMTNLLVSLGNIPLFEEIEEGIRFIGTIPPNEKNKKKAEGNEKNGAKGGDLKEGREVTLPSPSRGEILRRELGKTEEKNLETKPVRAFEAASVIENALAYQEELVDFDEIAALCEEIEPEIADLPKEKEYEDVYARIRTAGLIKIAHAATMDDEVFAQLLEIQSDERSKHLLLWARKNPIHILSSVNRHLERFTGKRPLVTNGHRIEFHFLTGKLKASIEAAGQEIPVHRKSDNENDQEKKLPIEAIDRDLRPFAQKLAETVIRKMALEERKTVKQFRELFEFAQGTERQDPGITDDLMETAIELKVIRFDPKKGQLGPYKAFTGIEYAAAQYWKTRDHTSPVTAVMLNEDTEMRAQVIKIMGQEFRKAEERNRKRR